MAPDDLDTDPRNMSLARLRAMRMLCTLLPQNVIIKEVDAMHKKIEMEEENICDEKTALCNEQSQLLQMEKDNKFCLSHDPRVHCDLGE